MNTKTFDSFKEKVWLSTPTKHEEVKNYLMETYEDNWITTAGKNIEAIEKQITEKVDCKYAVALSSGTATLHLCMRLAGEKIYGRQPLGKGSLHNRLVFCSSMTFVATVNPIVYEGGTPVFIDSEYETWNMDPVALEKAFEKHPEVKIVVAAHLYGTPGKIDEIRAICDKYGAVLIEDAAESFGATYKGTQTGIFGDYGVISFNGNKIITGSSGGMFLTDSMEDANKVRKWSTQSRDNAPWYEHTELGYNYRMSNVCAGIVRGQFLYLDEHIAQKKAIYERYKEGFKGLPVRMNPIDYESAVPNYWLSCMIIDREAMCRQVRNECEALFLPEHGKTCPTEILETLAKYNAEGRPIWHPLHHNPLYSNNEFFSREGYCRATTDAYINGGIVGKDGNPVDVCMDIFSRGLCLPSDNKMTPKQQDRVIEIVRACFE